MSKQGTTSQKSSKGPSTKQKQVNDFSATDSDEKDSKISPIRTEMETSPNPISDLTGEESAIQMRNIGLGDRSSGGKELGTGVGMSASEENEYLRKELGEVHMKLREYSDEVPDLVEFNKEL